MKIQLLMLTLFLSAGYSTGFTQDIPDESDRIIAKQDSVWKSLTGKVFPMDSLITIDGKVLDVSGITGKPTLINFWFTTCKPCIDEMPVLNTIRQSYLNKVNFVAVTFEDKIKVKEFLTKHKFDFLQLVDAQKYIDRIGFITFPITVIMDKNAVVVSIHHGIPYVYDGTNGLKIGDGKELKDILEQLL